MTAPRVLVLGASGRLGRMLQRQWRDAWLQPLWQTRRDAGIAEAQVFDPLGDPAQIARRLGPVDVVIGLAGVTPGRGDLALNTDLARAACAIGAATGARRVFASSSAAVYGRPESPVAEDAALRPETPYGHAKAEMEATLRCAAPCPVTVLRIGNVAGADALLDQPGAARCLDRFADGQGPRRAYIGPRAFADVLASLAHRATEGDALPDTLNLAQPGTVAMADLCHAAGLTVTWRPAPPEALPELALDLGRLARLMPLPEATPASIVADWQADRAMA